MPNCDVCDRPIGPEEGYALTTSQVVASESYWKFVFSHQWPSLREDAPESELVPEIAMGAAAQASAWTVCESCAELFQFDRDAAGRGFARSGVEPPGTGPADVKSAAMAAGYAWSALYGFWPSGVRSRVDPPPADGVSCDFCHQRLYEDEEVLLLKNDVVRASRDFLPTNNKGPSRHIAGEDFWVVCPYCTSRAAKRREATESRAEALEDAAALVESYWRLEPLVGSSPTRSVRIAQITWILGLVVSLVGISALLAFGLFESWLVLLALLGPMLFLAGFLANVYQQRKRWERRDLGDKTEAVASHVAPKSTTDTPASSQPNRPTKSRAAPDLDPVGLPDTAQAESTRRAVGDSGVFVDFRCLKCATPFPEQDDGRYSIVSDEVRFHVPGGMVAGEMACRECDEAHDFLYSGGELTLSLVAVSTDYQGAPRRVYPPKPVV